MIKLYGFGGFSDLAKGTIDASPFVLKVAVYLKMAGVEFEQISNLMHLLNTPKGKMPVLDDNGYIVADSTFIVDYLKYDKGINLDKHLDAQQLAISHAFTKMIEENLYWCLVYARYRTDFICPLLEEGFRNEFPLLLRQVGPRLFREKLKTQVLLQGIGKHSYAEVVTLTKKDARSLSVLLGDKPYFFGETPSAFDAVAFGFLAQFILMQTQDEILLAVTQHQNLCDFCHRIYQPFYGSP